MRFDLETRYADYDTAGHVNNAVYLTYFEIARTKAWVAMLGPEAAVSYVLAEALVRYVSRAQLGEPLAVEITTAEVRSRSWTWRYRVVDARGDRLVAEGHTVQVMFDYAAGVPTHVPDALREQLARV
jgi:acyl-CoA thioester hydrolase